MAGSENRFDQLEFLVGRVFLNELIAAKIMKCLPVDTWKSFRLVCRDWCKTANNIRTDKAFVRLQTCEDTTSTISKSVKLFLEYMKTKNLSQESLGEYPFQNFSLENWSIVDSKDNIENIESYKKFSKDFSKQIRHLQLVDFKFQKDNAAFFNLVRNLACNAKTLEVIANKKWIGSFDFISPLYLKTDIQPNLRRLEVHWSLDINMKFLFLLKFPNLKELKLKTKDRRYATKLIPTLCMLTPLRKKQKALNLTHLDLIEADQSIHGFVETDLPLKYLSLHVHDAIKYNDFQRILEHYARLLETLKLIRLPTQRSPPFANFPFRAKFENLRELDLWGNISANLDFLLVTPVLKRLRIDLYCFDKRDSFPELYRLGGKQLAIRRDLVQNSKRLLQTESFSIPSLEEFLIESVLKVESWKILGAWMPNLNILVAPLNNDTFQVVCGQWNNLSNLKLRLGSDIDDKGITGLRNAIDRVPNITDLKHLRSFELEVLCGRGKLTDIAATQGFLYNMSNLLNLSIHVSELMSSEMEEKLKSKIENMKISRRKGTSRNFQKVNEGKCCLFVKLMKELNVTNFY